MKLLVIYGCDNGYTCSCCGYEWEESAVVECDKGETPEEAVEYEKKYLEKSYTTKHGGRKEILAAYVISRTLIEKED